MANVKPTYVSTADGLPKPVDTAADSVSANAVYVQTSATPDTSVGISRDGSDNLVLADLVAGSKTLSQLAAGGGGGPDAGQREPALARYDFAGVPVLAPPLPAAPTFSGALITCGTGGTHATLTAAVAAASAGDRIQILPGTITEAATVTVNKSLEIFGTGATCIVQRDSAVVPAGVVTVSATNVYIHDFCIINNTSANADAGGQSACINAATMSRTSYSGVSGTYIASMLLQHPKVGVFISGTSWVVRNCTFEPSAANVGATTQLRPVFTYGSEGSSYVSGNTFRTTTSEAQVVGVYINTVNDGIAPAWESGYKGNVIINGNSFIDGGGAPRAYVDATSMLHQSGPAATEAPNGQCSFYLTNNDFSLPHRSSPVVFFGRGGASAPNVLSFFNNFTVYGNSFGDREASTNQKGAIFFTRSSGSALSLGAFTGSFYAASNTIAPMTLPAANVSIMADSSLLMVRDSTYYPAPVPLLTSDAPVSVPSGPLTADGVALVPGNRAFLFNTSDSTYSGLYDVQAGAWTRVADMAAGDDGAGLYWWVLNGTSYGNTGWVVSNASGSAVVGTNALTFRQTGGLNGQSYTPGAAVKWAYPAPTTSWAALDRLAAAVYGLLGGPIP